MKSILLGFGHWNIENISTKGLRKWRSAVSLRKSTGASGERDWLWTVLRPKLTEKLIAKGIQVFVTDAIYNKEIYSRDYNLCIFSHFDAGNENSRCMIAKPRPTIEPVFISPEASKKADDFISEWLATYPLKARIASKQSAVTEGMTDYYAWDYVGTETPSVIIEHGNNTCPADHDTMFNQPDLIAEADVEAVVNYFGLEPETPPSPTTSPQDSNIEVLKRVDELSLRVAESEISQTQTKDEVNKIVPRLDSIAHDISDLNKDRAILETIQGNMAGIEEKVKLNSETVKSSETNLKAEIRLLQASVSDEIESIKVRVKVLEERLTSDTGISIIAKFRKFFIGRWK